jgi:hypothetical protein
MSLFKRCLEKVRSSLKEKGYGLFFLIPCLFYLSADIGQKDAAASILTPESLDAIQYEIFSDQAGIKEDLPVVHSRAVKTNLALSPKSLIDVGEAFADFSFKENESVLQPPETGKMALHVVSIAFKLPEFKDKIKESLFARLKPLSIHNEAEYAAARHCLAEAIYFESRDEPERGQRAVAQVVLNRVKSGYYPSTICGVIYQNANHRNACQFSYACDGKPERITEIAAWRQAKKLADDAITARVYLKDIGDATHYHANYVWPDWRFEMKRIKQIGTHIFYAMHLKRAEQI